MKIHGVQKDVQSRGIPKNWVTSQAGPLLTFMQQAPWPDFIYIFDTSQTWMFCEWRLLVRFLGLPPQTLQACCSLLWSFWPCILTSP
jgi:hypothetical protein